MTEKKTTREFDHENAKSTLLELTPVDPDGLFVPITVNVERGTLTTTKTDGTVQKSERFLVSWRKPNAEDDSVGIGAKIDKALGACLRNAGYGTEDDYTYDTDNEFFAAAPKANSDDEDPFARDDADELLEERKRINALGVLASETEGNAQAAWRDFSFAMDAVFQKLGRNGKAFKRWAEGAKHSGEAPMLATLAKGKNALSETRILATLSDTEFSVLPTHYTKGGSVDIFVRDAVRGDTMSPIAGAVLDAGNFDTQGDGKQTLSASQLEAAIKALIDQGIGITAPYTDIADGLNKASDALRAQVEDYLNTIGKDWAKVDDRKMAEAAAKRIMGRLRLFNLASEAWNLECDLDQVVNSGDKGAMEKLSKERNSCGFVANVVAAANKVKTEHENEKAKRAREASAKKAIEDAEPLADAKKLTSEPAMAVAARLFNTIKDHPSGDAIMDALNEMWDTRPKAEPAKVAAE